MKKRATVAWLAVLLLTATGVPAGAVTLDEYGGLFEAVLGNMMDHYAWQEDPQGNPIVGNWDEDEMYDSTLFAPDILYRLSQDPDYGDEAAREQVRVLADQTVAYETGVLLEYLLGEEDLMLEAFAGAPCLIDSLKVRANPVYTLVLFAAFGMVKDIVAEDPNFLGDYMGYVCTHGLTAFYGLYFADVDKLLLGKNTQDTALEIIGWAVDKYWNEADGRFWPIENLYENGWMLMALAYAYGATADPAYKDMADAVMVEIDTHLWDDLTGDGGYWEYGPFMYKPSLGRWKKLSTHERIARAMLHWYEVSGDAIYLDQARKMLDYAEAHLCAEDRNHPGRTICYHHWTEVSGLPHLISDPEDPGYDPYFDHPFCTGCNFNLLIDIYLLNQFVQESQDYPRPVGSICGVMVSGDGAAPVGWGMGLALLLLPWMAVRSGRRTGRSGGNGKT